MKTEWTSHKLSLLQTTTGFKLNHVSGRTLRAVDDGELYEVSDKGKLSMGGFEMPKLGNISSVLVDVTEQLRVEWLEVMSRDEPNHYEIRQRERRERYQSLAQSARTEGAAAHKRAREMLDVIPLGQPILIGHHSERRHRNHIQKTDALFRKAFVDCAGKADHYESKAAGIGHGGISSDDPEAIFKLTRKLQGCIASQELMKASNKAIRGNKTPESQLSALIALGHSESDAAELLKGDFCGRIGFASYALSNNNGEIARLKNRIAQLRKFKSEVSEPEKEEYDTFAFEVNKEENRLMFIFDGKPAENVRALLSSNAFKWSPRRGAWVRKITPNAMYAASLVKRQLAEL